MIKCSVYFRNNFRYWSNEVSHLGIYKTRKILIRICSVGFGLACSLNLLILLDKIIIKTTPYSVLLQRHHTAWCIFWYSLESPRRKSLSKGYLGGIWVSSLHKYRRITFSLLWSASGFLITLTSADVNLSKPTLGKLLLPLIQLLTVLFLYPEITLLLILRFTFHFWACSISRTK